MYHESPVSSMLQDSVFLGTAVQTIGMILCFSLSNVPANKNVPLYVGDFFSDKDMLVTGCDFDSCLYVGLDRMEVLVMVDLSIPFVLVVL